MPKPDVLLCSAQWHCAVSPNGIRRVSQNLDRYQFYALADFQSATPQIANLRYI